MDFIRNMVYARTDANEKHNGCVCYRTHQRAKRYQYIGGLRMMKKWVKMGLMAVIASSLCVSMTACKSDKKANNSAVQKEKAVKNNADADKQKTYTLFLGEQYELEEKEKAEYVIADTSVASVSPEGIVHACKAGKTTITVTKDGKKSSSALKIKKRGMVYPTFTMMKGEKSVSAGQVQMKRSPPLMQMVLLPVKRLARQRSMERAQSTHIVVI